MGKFIVGCVGVAAAVLVVGGVAFWFLFVRQLPSFEASVATPEQVFVGEPVVLSVTARNPHSHAITLHSIDVSNRLLDHFQVLAVSPEPTETYPVPIVNMRSWSFLQEVEAGGELVVEFELKPIEAGHVRGDVDVCNPNQDCTTVLADVVVDEAAVETPLESP